MAKKLYENGPPMPKAPPEPPKQPDTAFESGIKKLIKPTKNIEDKLKEMGE